MPNWIGGVIGGPSIEMDLRSEGMRVIKNYISSTNASVNQRANRNFAPVVTASEIITSVSNIVVRQAQDQIFVRVVLTTASASEFSLLINPGGGG